MITTNCYRQNDKLCDILCIRPPYYIINTNEPLAKTIGTVANFYLEYIVYNIKEEKNRDTDNWITIKMYH